MALRKWSEVAAVVVLGGIAFTACSGGPTPHQRDAAGALASSTTTTLVAPATAPTTTTSTTSITTTTTSTPTTSTTLVAPVAIPDIVGQYIRVVRHDLAAAGLRYFSVNQACTKGTLVSQSVAQSMKLRGPPPAILHAGSLVAPGAKIGITWSGCYGKGVTVPNVVGLSWHKATSTVLGVGGLHWTCVPTISPTPSGAEPGPVTAQSPPAGTNVPKGSAVALTVMYCP